MDNIKGLLVKYPVFEDEEFDFYQYGRLIEFKNTPDGIEALVMTDEGDESGDYYFDSVPISNLVAPREGNELFF